MYEIIANPKDYEIEALVEGMGYKQIPFPQEERQKWAEEIGAFAQKLEGLADRAKFLQDLFTGKEAIMATPAALKNLKVQFFKINAAMTTALNLAGKIEGELIKK